MAAEGRADRRAHCQQTTRHAFTDVVVGVTGQVQLNAACVPHTEALTRSAAEVRGNRIRCQPLVTVRLRDITGERRAHGTVGVADIKPERLALLLVHIRFRLLQQLRIQHAIVKRWVVLGAVHRFAWVWLRGFQQLAELQLLLLRREAFQLFQQVGTANQIHQTLHAQLRHQLAGFPGDEVKVVGHFERQPVIVVLTQLLILGSHTGCAVVQVANTQVFTAERHHWACTEAEAFRTEDRGFDDVEARFQATVHLKTDLMTQTVRHQRLLGFHQSQLPRAARVFHGGERACTGTAVVAGDGNEIRISFRHAGGDGAHARFGNQLHGDHRFRVDLFQVENQLR